MDKSENRCLKILTESQPINPNPNQS